MERRRFVKILAISTAGATLPIRHLEAAGITEPVLKPGTMITSIPDFYKLQIENVPTINAAPSHWKLLVTGLVEKNQLFTYEDITSMPSITAMRTLKCIGDSFGTTQMSNAEWTGVPLRVFLEKAGIKPEAKVVVFRCRDSYHTAIPIADAMREETLLAYKMNGVDLPKEQIFKKNLLNPGHYGTKNPKWIITIQLAKKHEGYWEKWGWDPVASVKLVTMIGTPGEDSTIKAGETYTISGAAFDSGNHGGIKSVEVSLDEGKTWKTAEIWASDSPLAWTLWKYTWQAPDEEGLVNVYARATANDGLMQKATGFDAAPAGAVSYHTVEAKVAK
ncbi:MAG: molybdopterin-dependent oxidoreductase [Candidatus Poribacteria bacterium]|nr:molybdopterin-dependent oxidoreductase [Candidatus Poribacteria bacterium]